VRKLTALTSALGWALTALALPHARGLAQLWPEELALDVHGFVDVRGGLRTGTDAYEGDTALAETRLQLEMSHFGDLATVQLKADFYYDDPAEESNPDLETGAGPVDLREANVLFSPFGFMDVKVGRQILTWGTGDLVFINDLFPKDWQAFFLGRDDEYLKAPSDAIFVSLFPEWANIDIAYTPQFDADRYVSGERLSYWNPMLSATSGRNAVVDADYPDEWFRDDEVAIRVSRNVSGYELALYGYQGYWKSPEGYDVTADQSTFPDLGVYGASARGTLGKGIANVELGYYESQDDTDGDDAYTPNSEWRFLIGYERELGRDLTLGVQYYLESIEDYGEYERSMPDGTNLQERNSHNVTLRLTKLLLNQNLTLSFFLRYSPTEDDAYLRPSLKYKLTDNWLLSCGANVFLGEESYTFLGQFEDNTNVYAALRYSF